MDISIDDPSFNGLDFSHSLGKSSSGVGAMRVELKLPCNMNVKGRRYLMNERIKFHHNTEFFTSCSRHSGLSKFSIPPEITLRSSFFKTHGLNRSQRRGEAGPLDPTNVGRVLWTQKCGTKFVWQLGQRQVYS